MVEILTKTDKDCDSAPEQEEIANVVGYHVDFARKKSSVHNSFFSFKFLS